MPKNTFIRAAAVSYPLSIKRQCQKKSHKEPWKNSIPSEQNFAKRGLEIYSGPLCTMVCTDLDQWPLEMVAQFEYEDSQFGRCCKRQSSNIHICLEVFCCHKNLCFKYIDILENIPWLLKDMESIANLNPYYGFRLATTVFYQWPDKEF